MQHTGAFPGSRKGRRFAGRIFCVLAACVFGLPHTSRAEGSGTEAARAAYREDVQRRRDFVASVYAGTNVRKDSKWYPYYILARTARNGCDPDLSEYIARVTDAPDPDQPGAIAPEPFAGPPLVRYLYRHRDCLSAEQIARLAATLAKPRPLFEHSTLNIATMTTTSTYLLAQAFPQVTWTNLDGKAYGSAEILRLYKRMMVRRYSKFLQDGDYEQLSPSYAAQNLYPTLNLVEFAEDRELIAYAEAYAVQLLAIQRASALQGVILAPLHRQNAQQRSGPARSGRPCVSPSQHALWLFFGEPEVGRLDLDSGCEPTYVTMPADSAWLPPVLLNSFPDPRSGSAEHSATTPTFSIWDAPTWPSLIGKVFRGRHFAIGSGNAMFDPGGYNTNDNTFTLAYEHPSAEFNYIECFHPYWTSNAGIDARSFSRARVGQAPYVTSRSSPFQQSHFDKGRGVLLFSIPKADPWPASKDPRLFGARDRQKDALFTRQNCHFPKSVDEYVVDGSWVFIRAGRTHIGIEAVGLTPKVDDSVDDPTVLGFNKLTTDARHAALFFVAEDAETRRSFAEFQRAAKAVPRRHDPVRDSFTFEAEDGRSNEVTFKIEPSAQPGYLASVPIVTVNGEPVTQDTGTIIAGPTYRIGKGRLRLETSAGVLDIAPGPEGWPRITETLRTP